MFVRFSALMRFLKRAMSAVPDVGRTQRLQYQFTSHLRDPERNLAPAGMEDRRVGIYRELVFANMESFMSSNFPVIRQLYDDDAWNAMARDFLRTHQCHTPLFPEFGREFMRYIEARMQRGENDPPFLLELAHYEWAELALSLDEQSIDDVPHDAHGDPMRGIPVMSPLACVLGYRFAVQHIGPEFRPMEVPPVPTLLLLVRGRDDEVRFFEIDTLTAVLIEQLQQNETASGAQCVDALLAEHGAVDDAMRAAGREMLSRLKSYEAILGTRQV
jgi:uncharacterized protein